MSAPIKATVANFKKGAADMVESSQPHLDDVFEFFSSGQFSKGKGAHSVPLRSHLEEFDPVFDRCRLLRRASSPCRGSSVTSAHAMKIVKATN